MTIPKLNVNVDLNVKADVRTGKLQTSVLLMIFLGFAFLLIAKKFGINVENQVYFWPILSGSAVIAFLIGYRRRPFGELFVTAPIAQGGSDDQG